MSQFQRIIQMMFKWISNNILLFLSCSTTNLTHLTAEFTRTEHTLCLYRTNEEKCFVSLKCYVCLNCCTARTVLSIQTKSMYALATNSMWIFRYFASVLSRVRFSSLFQPRIKRERRNNETNKHVCALCYAFIVIVHCTHFLEPQLYVSQSGHRSYCISLIFNQYSLCLSVPSMLIECRMVFFSLIFCLKLERISTAVTLAISTIRFKQLFGAFEWSVEQRSTHLLSTFLVKRLFLWTNFIAITNW